MSDAPRGYATWIGNDGTGLVGGVIGASMTLVQGIRPSIAQLEIIPQPASVPIDGTLTFYYGDTTFSFYNCRVDKASFVYSEQGLLWRFSIMDRRWKWAFAGPGQGGLGASGHWNVRYPNIGVFGSIDQSTVFTPQQMANDLFRSLGEQTWDASQLPNDSRPEQLWDFDNPAQVLADLVEGLGCRIVLGVDDVPRVVRQGVGADLPPGSVLRVSAVVDPPELPDSLVVAGGKSLYQVALPLEAVGLDVDGTIQPINSLSYMPKGGWNPVDRTFFRDVAGWETAGPQVNPNLQTAASLGWVNRKMLAQQTVWRWYRVTGRDADGSGQMAKIPGCVQLPGQRIQALYQILPLNDHQVQGWYDPANANAFHPFPAYVYGTYNLWGFPGFLAGMIDPSFPAGTNNSLPGSFCVADFTVDREFGIVKFSQQMFLQNADGSTGPATLTLLTSVSPTTYTSESAIHYARQRVLPGDQHNTGPRVLKREEIVFLSVPTYDGSGNVTAIVDNQAECDREADYILDAIQQEYQTVVAADQTYAGLIVCQPDGAIAQVTWTVGPQGATTRVSRNTEWHPVVPSYRERRLLQQMAQAPAVVQRLQNQQRKG